MTLPVPAPAPLPAPVIDSHTHLDIIADYSGLQPGAAVAAAAAAGVTGVIQVGVDVGSSRRSVALATEHDGVWATVAVHPNEAPVRFDTGHLDSDLATLADLAREPRVVGIGETGLDYYRTGGSGRAAQQASFREHIRLAKDVDKTLVIHDREAHDDVFTVLADEGAPQRVVFHCFSGDEEFARRCADAGYYLSFAGTVTFRNAEELRRAALAAPPDRLLVETDAPFLTPVPHRGKPNAPYLLPHTVTFLADLLAVDLTTFCDLVHANTVAAFAIDV